MTKNIYEMKPGELDLMIAENQAKQKDSYAIENRGYITASKCKAFMKSAENYFLKYVLEIPSDNGEKKHFTIGTAVDDYISYWELEFYKKYYVPSKKMLKADWFNECVAIEEARAEEDVTHDDILAKLKPLGVEELKAIALKGKNVLTAEDSKKIFAILDEYKRQPLFDFEGKYETQKEIEFKYKTLTLKAKLDRFSLDLWLIRDMKTCSSLKKFIYDVQDYNYDFSMSFYNILCKLAYKKDFKLILDACQTTKPYPSESFVMPPETVATVGKRDIMPTLNTLNKLHEEWEKTKDPKVWLREPPVREFLYDCEMYSQMETTIQKEFTYLQ